MLAALMTAPHRSVHRAAYPGGDSVDLCGGQGVRVAAAVKLSMVLHELCTNACRYGALAGEHGSISVSWDLKQNPNALSFSWKERRATDAAAVQPNKGFGFELISILVERDLRGKIDVAWQAEGICVEMKIPADSFAAVG